MPSSYPHFIPKELFASQIQRFIPKTWKEGIKQLEKPSSILEPSLPVGDSMIDSLLASIKTYAREGHLSEAFKSLSLIKLHASSSTSCDAVLHSISSLLFSCTNHKSFPQGKQLHAHIIRLGLEQHPILVPKLVTFYSSFNSHVDAHIVVENSNILHPLPWNLLISSYVKNELLDEALATYEQMVNKGIRPDCFTYPSVLKACGEKLDIGFGKEVHKSIDASCQEWNLYVHNSLVSMYGKFGLVDVARQLFDIMPQRDIISWNSMISCYASKGMWNEAFELFGKLQMEGTEVSIITWNTIAGGCLRTGNIKGALELLSQMRVGGIKLDSVAFTVGLSASSHIGAIKLGKEMHGSANNVRNALITMYSRCKDLSHAYTLFESIGNRSIVTWNSMISGYSHMDRAEEASFIFRAMLCSGIEPNYVTIASVLPLCARVANLQHGKEFHCYITKRVVFDDYLLLWNALVDMYARSGRVIEAKRVFDSMNKKDEVTYTSMIAGYGVQGEGKAALKLFEDMNSLNIQPDHVTMVSILSACSHSGLVIQGQILFERMVSMYSITPDLEHYACMVDLYGRAGLLHPHTCKQTIIKDACTANMTNGLTYSAIATLIGACRIHGNTEIGEWAAEMLLQMRPENSGYYVLIANMYAAAGSWNNLARVRTFMRDLGVRKAPGCAWVDVGDGFSLFLVGDTTNQLRNEIYLLLDGLNELMKDADYIREDFSSDYEVFE
ncbi:pentatricopeptide repeat-containing protein [Rosa sericea]